MILLFPILCLPLGLPGMIPAFFAGILGDQILLMVFVTRMVTRTLAGYKIKNKVVSCFLDQRVIAQLGLMVRACEISNRGIQDFENLRAWIDQHAQHSRLVFPQHSRICYELFSFRQIIDSSSLLGILLDQAESRNNEYLLETIAVLVSAGDTGVDQVGLDYLQRLSVGLNIADFEFSRILNHHISLNRPALEILMRKIPENRAVLTREKLYQAFSQHTSMDDGQRDSNVRLAFSVLEDQMDLVERAIHTYEQTRACSRPHKEF